MVILPPQRHLHPQRQLWSITSIGAAARSLTAQTLRDPHDPLPAGGLTPGRATVYYEVVPGGVARVRWAFARQPLGALEPGPTYAKPLEITVPVHNNVAATGVPAPERGYVAVDTWYAADGSVIASRGSSASLQRVVPAPPR